MAGKIFLKYRVANPQVGTQITLTVHYPGSPRHGALCLVEKKFAIGEDSTTTINLPIRAFARLKTDLEKLSLPLRPASRGWLDTPSHDLQINTPDRRIRVSWTDPAPPWMEIQAFLEGLLAEFQVKPPCGKGDPPGPASPFSPRQFP